jgi:Zn-dependent protease
MLTQAAQRAIFRDPRPGRPLLEFILLALPVLIFSLVAHEYAHGFAALKQGDDTALQQGRLTLNPLPHIDPWLTVIMPALLWYLSKGAFVFGGAKPVQVRPDRYRNYRRGDIIVSSAGILTNLAITVLCALLFIGIGLLARAIPGGADVISTAQRMLYWGVALNLLLGFFNLIPIPPLDGSHILYHLLPAGLRNGYRAIQRLGFLPLLALLILLPPSATRVLLTPAYAGVALFHRLASPFAVGTNWNIFHP